MVRLSGPGTRSKNPKKYDDIRRQLEENGVKFPRKNTDGKGPQLSKRKARLEARRTSCTASHEGRLSGRRMDPVGYRMPGSMSK